MNRNYRVRLEGGPADGDCGTYTGNLKARLYAAWCGGCLDWHWFDNFIPGGEVYKQAEVDDDALSARYVYSDCVLDGDSDREKELIEA